MTLNGKNLMAETFPRSATSCTLQMITLITLRNSSSLATRMQSKLNSMASTEITKSTDGMILRKMSSSKLSTFEDVLPCH